MADEVPEAHKIGNDSDARRDEDAWPAGADCDDDGGNAAWDDDGSGADAPELEEVHASPRPKLNRDFLLREVNDFIKKERFFIRGPWMRVALEWRCAVKVSDPKCALQRHRGGLATLREGALESLGYVAPFETEGAGMVCLELRDLAGKYICRPKLFPGTMLVCDQDLHSYLDEAYRSFVHMQFSIPSSWGSDKQIMESVINGDIGESDAERAWTAMQHRKAHKAAWIFSDATFLDVSDKRTLEEVFHALGCSQLDASAGKKLCFQLVVQKRADIGTGVLL